MKICYNKLWNLLIDTKFKRAELKRFDGISSGSPAKLGKDENIGRKSEKIRSGQR